MNRCHPTALHLKEQALAGRDFVYHDARDIDEMLKPDFWLNVAAGKDSDRLLPSYFIDLFQCKYVFKGGQTKAAKVLEVARVVVLETTREGPKLGVIYRHSFIEPAAVEYTTRHLGGGTYAVVKGGEDIEKFKATEGGEAAALRRVAEMEAA